MTVVRIGIRDLRADLAGVVRRADAGESFVITVSGRPAATLGPVGRDGAGPTLDELIALGAVVPPRTQVAQRRVARERVPVDARSDRELRKVR